MIYALGVGACGRDATDNDELKYVYHENGPQFIQVFSITFLFVGQSLFSKSVYYYPDLIEDLVQFCFLGSLASLTDEVVLLINSIFGIEMS